jgi:curved DNA-binding protein
MIELDPYFVLGVGRSASEEEIRKSYRALARMYHPDVNGNSESSQARFREIAQAYEILRDRVRRGIYDRENPQFAKPTPKSAPGQTGSSVRSGFFRKPRAPRTSVFSRARGAAGSGKAGTDTHPGTGSQPRKTWAKGSDVDFDLAIDFVQALQGVSVELKILDRAVEVHIPAGVDTGARMRIPGQGAPGLRGGPNGDLFLNISVREHKLFRREGEDIHLDIPISIGEATLGTEIDISGPEGLLRLKIPPGTQSGTKFRYKGKGFPSPAAKKRGAFYVNAHVVIPGEIDSVSRDLLIEFEKRNPLPFRRGL